MLAAAPVAVLFERVADPEVQPTHRSGRIDPSLLPFLVDVTQRARGRLAYGDGRDNPYLIALALACFYLVEGARSDALGLRRLAGQMPAVSVVAPEAAEQDIQVRRGSTALRVIAPVESDDGDEVLAAVELTWGRPRPGAPATRRSAGGRSTGTAAARGRSSGRNQPPSTISDGSSTSSPPA